jgi:GNAT superfamily N-acetyltransferase
VHQITLRRTAPADADRCGRICHDAFRAISEAHAFPPDFPSPEVATGLLASLIGHRGFHGVLAEMGGRVVGSNFLDERDAVAGVGPITVDPEVQDARVGRRLMEGVLDRADGRGFVSVRLCQAAYHNRSLALYTKLGFDAREPLSCVQGVPPAGAVSGRHVRRAGPDDIGRCGDLCERVHGHRRDGEMADAVSASAAVLVERDGRMTGYASQLAFFGHAVAETNEDLAALIAAAPGFAGPGFLVPTRNAELLRWCLSHGLRIVQPMTLMSRGTYAEPRGAWLPSVLY